MKYSACLILLSALPACFTSTGLDENGCEPNPCEYNVVDFCEISRECEELAWCGGTIFCEFTSPPPVCTEPRPACADSVEVVFCPPGANCTSFEWCGETLYCASESCDAAFPPSCPDGATPSDIPCAEDEFGCTAMTGCDEGYYCHSPFDCFDPEFTACDEATSTVWAMSEGECPDFDDGAFCYDSLYCGSPYYCVTACAPGDEEVFHPSECVNSNDCYESQPWRDDLPPLWCQGGGGPTCRAIPTCEGGEEIPLDGGCDDDGYCEYRSECSTTIQCYFGIVVG
jgi:hypothetical protein